MKCSRCHSELSENLGGNCPACLLQGAVSLEFGGDSETDEAPLSEIGEYEILAEIGRGGAGVVYRARHRRLKRVAALKALHGSLLGSPEAFERFRVEAQAVARLDHPNIVPLYETGSANGTYYLTLRYFERGSLAGELEKRTFTPVEAVRFMATAARAIHFAHQHGVLHRDLKPSNLLIDDAGEAHIADFGLAKISGHDMSLTLSSSVLGTPNYMAPEQADGRAKEASVAVDIYSLGAILFELLTGRPPFVGETPLIVLRKVADEEPPRPRSLNPALDRDLEAICLHCLEKEPERRYSSAAAFADDLDHWLGGEPISVRSATALERSLRWVRRRPLVAGLAAACLAALMAGLAGVFWQWNRAERQRDEALRQAYAADMYAASQVFQDNNLGRARQILDRNRPAPGKPDLRGWEWRYLWQYCRGDAELILCRQPDLIYSVVPDREGRWLAIGQAQGGLTLWDLRTRQKLFETDVSINRFVKNLYPEGNRVGTRIAPVPGTSIVAYCESINGTQPVVKLWDADRRAIVRSLPQPSLVRHLAVTPDGSRLIVTTFNPANDVVVWNLKTGLEVTRYKARFTDFSIATPLAVSPDGRWATLDEDQTLRVVEIETGRDLFRLPLRDANPSAAAFSPDGKWLAAAAAYNDSMIQLWNLESGAEAGLFEGHQSWVGALLFAPDGQQLISGSSDQSIRVWDVKTRKTLRVLRGHESELSSLALSWDGRKLYSGSKEGEVIVWALDEPPQNRTGCLAPVAVQPHRWAFLPEGCDLLAVTSNRAVVRIRGPDFQRVDEFAAAGLDCVAAAPLSMSPNFVVAHSDSTVTLHDLPSGAAVRSFRASNHLIRHFFVLPRSDLLLTSDDQFLGRLWNPRTDEKLAEWKYPQGGFVSRIAPDGETLWVLYYDGTFIKVNVRNGERSEGRFDHGNGVSLAFSSAGDLMATASDKGTVRLVSPTTLETVSVLGRYRLASWDAVFAPGNRLATVGGREEALKLWDTRTGRELLSLSAPQNHGNPVGVSADGSTFAQQGRADGQLFIWRAPDWSEISEADFR